MPQAVTSSVVTIARAFTNSFSGIRPTDVPLLVVAQIAGALAATFMFIGVVRLTAFTGRNTS